MVSLSHGRDSFVETNSSTIPTTGRMIPLVSQLLSVDEPPTHARQPGKSEVESFSQHTRVVEDKIWITIFDWYAAQWCTFRAIAPETSALVLGHVCRRWRRLTLSMPQLWNNPPIVRITQEFREDERFKEGWEHFLRRSGNLPLKLHLLFELPVGEVPHRPFSVLKPFLDRSTRWEHLTVSGLMVMQVQVHLGSVYKNVPRLRSLTFNFAETTVNFAPGAKFDAFEFAPELTRINTYSTTLSPRKSHMYFPWDQLTSFRQNSIDITTLLRLLKCGELETLRYKGSKFLYRLNGPISHFKLRHLVVEIQQVEQFWRCLEDVTLPALETFSLKVMTRLHQEQPPQVSTLKNLVIRSSCSLKKLVLDFHMERIGLVGLRALFSCTGDLETLEIGDCYGVGFCKYVLMSLVFKRNQTTLLPRLRCLTLNVRRDLDWLADIAIPKLVASREKVVVDNAFRGQLLAPLEHMRIVTSRKCDRYRFIPQVGGWEDPLEESIFNLSDIQSSPLINETNILLSRIRKLRKPREHEPTPELLALFALSYLVEDTRLRQEALSSLEKLGMLSTLQTHMLRHRWIPGCKEDIFYIHPDHNARLDAVSGSALWEAIANVDLKRLDLLLGYHLMEEREDDLVDVGVMDDDP